MSASFFPTFPFLCNALLHRLHLRLSTLGRFQSHIPPFPYQTLCSVWSFPCQLPYQDMYVLPLAPNFRRAEIPSQIANSFPPPNGSQPSIPQHSRPLSYAILHRIRISRTSIRGGHNTQSVLFLSDHIMITSSIIRPRHVHHVSPPHFIVSNGRGHTLCTTSSSPTQVQGLYQRVVPASSTLHADHPIYVTYYSLPIARTTTKANFKCRRYRELRRVLISFDVFSASHFCVYNAQKVSSSTGNVPNCR